MANSATLFNWISPCFKSDRFKLIQRCVYSNLPLSGCLSYAALNLHVSIGNGLPGCGPRLASTLLVQSHLGIGIYLYNSPWAQSLARQRRILHTGFLAVLFNFGSILFVAATKNAIPNWNLLKGIYALIASYGLVAIGLDILSVTRADESRETEGQSEM